MQGILKTIWKEKELRLKERKSAVPEAQLLRQIEELPARPRHVFSKALAEKASLSGCSVIAEIKKASPSKGLIRPKFNPQEIAKSYERNGAACLSVLTEEGYFLGSSEILMQVRACSSLPILRKDFLSDPYQILEARAWGADAVLLIAAALSSSQLGEMAQAAEEQGLDVLVESHDEEELERALEIPRALIGINNRNLDTFEVSLETTVRLKQLVPSDRWLVSESGIHDRADVSRLKQIGIRSFLVGEVCMRKADPGAGLRELFYAVA